MNNENIITTIQITKGLEKKLNRAKKELNMSKSLIIRTTFKYITELHEFMEFYMIPKGEKPPQLIIDKIYKIEELLNALNG